MTPPAVTARYAANPRVRYVDQSRSINLADRALSFDGVHLAPRGNQMMAENLADAIFEALHAK